MKHYEVDFILGKLDSDRWAFASAENIAREFSPDGSSCRIVAARLDTGSWEDLVASERALADDEGIVVIPQAESDRVLTAAECRAAKDAATPIDEWERSHRLKIDGILKSLGFEA